MKEHINIILLTTILSFFLAPIISATYIGIITGEPLIIIYPAVIPVAFIVGGPFALVGASIFIIIGIKKIRDKNKRFTNWLIHFALCGFGFGVVSSLTLWLLYGDGNSTNVLVGLKFILPNLVITSTLMSIILAMIWHRYNLKRSA